MNSIFKHTFIHSYPIYCYNYPNVCYGIVWFHDFSWMSLAQIFQKCDCTMWQGIHLDVMYGNPCVSQHIIFRMGDYVPGRVADHILEPVRQFIDDWLTPRNMVHWTLWQNRRAELLTVIEVQHSLYHDVKGTVGNVHHAHMSMAGLADSWIQEGL